MTYANVQHELIQLKEMPHTFFFHVYHPLPTTSIILCKLKHFV